MDVVLLKVFGEHVTTRKFPNSVRKISLNATIYNMFNRIA